MFGIDPIDLAVFMEETMRFREEAIRVILLHHDAITELSNYHNSLFSQQASISDPTDLN
jgi:hypothetical protein